MFRKILNLVMVFLGICVLTSCGSKVETVDLMGYCETVTIDSVLAKDYFEASVYRTKLVEDTNVITVTDNLQEAVDTAEAGSLLKLEADIVLESQVIIGKDLTIDFNEHTISNTTDIWNETDRAWSLVSVQGLETEVTLKNGSMYAKENDCYALDVREGAKLVIDGGTYVGNISSVYVLEGLLEIISGTFSIQQLSTNGGYEYTLNCLDANYAAGIAKINVIEAAFVGFDPLVNPEVELQEGYLLLTNEEDGVTSYIILLPQDTINLDGDNETPVEDVKKTYTERLEVLFKPGEIYVGFDTNVEDRNGYESQYLFRLDETSGKYFAYFKAESGLISSEEITEENFNNVRRYIVEMLFENVLPEKEEDILTSNTMIQGLTDITIEFKDKNGYTPVIKLEKNSGGVTLSYKLGEYGCDYGNGESILIDYRYPFGFNYTETPKFI